MNYDESKWITSWSRSQRGMGLVSQLYEPNQQITIQVPVTKCLRFRFSTWYEVEEITIQNVNCFCDGFCYPVTFEGKEAITISPQSTISCDEVNVSREITMYTLSFTIQANHLVSSAIQLIQDDCALAKHDLIYVLQSVDVVTNVYHRNVAVIGDSISEQATWTLPISQWLSSFGIGFLNHGISGNRLCRELSQVKIDEGHIQQFQEINDSQKDTLLGIHTGITVGYQCFGKAGIHRLKKEILDCDFGTTCMIFALGTNDLYQPGTFCASHQELINVSEFMSVYRYMFHQAKDKGMMSIALCIPSFKGTDSWTYEKEELRQQINQCLKEEPLLDGVVNFDHMVCNEQGELKAEYHNGDYLHPNIVGGIVMANLIQKELERCYFGLR